MSKFDTNWFDIDNYKTLADMDLMSWFRLLKSRWLLIHSMDHGNANNLSSTAAIIKKIPLFSNNPDYPSLLPDCYSPGYSFDESDKPVLSALSTEVISSVNRESGLVNFKSVNSLNALAIVQTYNINELANTWRDCNSVLRGEASEEQVISAVKPLDIILNSTEYKSAFAHVLVDTESTDEQILGDFKDWLSCYRLESKITVPKKNFTADKVNQWIKAGVIPYLDLTIVARIENRSITQAKLGNLIFPHDYDTCLTERIRKVTKPMAMSLMKEEIINAFQEQMIVSLVEGNSNRKKK